MTLHPEVTNHKSIITFKNLENTFHEIHNNKYDYSKSIYVNSDNKIEIICPIHGDFHQRPASHKNGQGCPKCIKYYKLTKDIFIERSIEIHGEKYDYSRVHYVNNSTKVTIICKQHGEFLQQPNNHMVGHGCPKCCGFSLTRNELIIVLHKIHNNKYDYSNLVWPNVNKKCDIICPEHGVFNQGVVEHKMGQGCPKCSKNFCDTDFFIEKSLKIHGNKYDYSKVEYLNTKSKVKIICKEHSEFLQTPNDHIQGNGCPECGRLKTNFEKYKNKPTTLYYVKINEFYKIGLTQYGISKRFFNDLKQGVNIEIIKTWEFLDGIDAYYIEQKVLRITTKFHVKKNISPIKVGWRELRSKNVINTIRKEIKSYEDNKN